MARKLLVSIPEYWEHRGSGIVAPPQNFEDMVERLNRKGGFWCVKTIDKYTGEVLVENWLENLMTDNGALSALKGLAGAAAPTTVGANNIAIDQSWGFTTLSAQIPASTATTSFSVNAPTGPTIPSGTWLTIGAGTGTTFTVQTTVAISAASTPTCNSATSPATALPIGSNVRYATPKEILAAGGTVPTGLSADVAALSAPASYAAATAGMPSGQFTYANSGGNAGYGNRQAVLQTGSTYEFSTSGTPAATAASYTSAWGVNANPVAAATNTFIHAAFDAPVNITSTTTGQVSITEKL